MENVEISREVNDKRIAGIHSEPIVREKKAVKKRKIGLLKVMSGADEGEQRPSSSRIQLICSYLIRENETRAGRRGTTERMLLLKLR